MKYPLNLSLERSELQDAGKIANTPRKALSKYFGGQTSP